MTVGTQSVLDIRDLSIDVVTKTGSQRIVDRVSLSVLPGERLGLIGESGSGKTMTLRAIAGLLPRGVHVRAGEILVDGTDVAHLDPAARRRAGTARIGMIFQEPMNALNPVMRVGDQIAEGPRHVLDAGPDEARSTALRLMSDMGIPDPERRYRAFPHELSGGLRQRVMIAIALSLDPVLLLCDEPTTALDVTVQDQILKLLARVTADQGRSLVYVTHDLAVVAQLCEQVNVMYAGQLMERGPTAAILREPHHPYTLGLLRCIPDIDRADLPLVPIPGIAPSVGSMPSGCRFRERCSFVETDCEQIDPALEPTDAGRFSACLHHERCREAAGEGAAHA